MRLILWVICVLCLLACSTSTVAVDESSSSKSSSSVKSVLEGSSSSHPVSSSSSSALSSSSSKDLAQAESSSSTEDSDLSECVGTPGVPWDGTTAKKFACGSGTKFSPYIILTAEQLALLSFATGAQDEDYTGKYFKLGADILLSDQTLIDENGALIADSSNLEKWTPIGNSKVVFTGYFDGDGHTVSGMFINTTSTHNGLFGSNAGTIENVIVTNSWVRGGTFTAGIVGYDYGIVSNVANEASVVGMGECTGGIVGRTSFIYAEKLYPNVKTVINKGVVSGGDYVGGVIGCMAYADLSDAVNKGDVVGKKIVGGISGYFSSSLNDKMVKNVQNYGKVTGTSDYVGGIAGYGAANYSTKCYSNVNHFYGALKNLYNAGDVEGKNFVGGLFGQACGASITNGANRGSVIGENTVGGLFGNIGYSTTENLYNRGEVAGSMRVGGIIGYNQEGVTSSAYTTAKVDGDSLVGIMIGENYNTTMADYYYISIEGFEPFGVNNGGGSATAKTSEEMKSSDFAELLGDAWSINLSVNDGYPSW